jgi:phosphopantothenoylcysteine decarboxylase/phosphopantothenate--cysteine ligase
MLIREGATVRVVLTPNAARFVAPLTFSALTGRTAFCEEFSGPLMSAAENTYAHLDLSRGIDCMVIAPATASTLAKLAGGHADNLLVGAYLSNVAPVVIAPAMNVRMWDHPATQANVRLLAERGNRIIQPGTGELACGDEGAGRLAPLEEIFAAVAESVPGDAPPDLEQTHLPLAGRRFIVTAGGTREYLDPVRFITNASTGRLGIETARSLKRRGAEVELVDTGIELSAEDAALFTERHHVQTAFDMLKVLSERMKEADGLVMLAAVADYTPAGYESTKHKKGGGGWSVELMETTDVLAGIARTRRPGQLLAGVSLEDSNWVEGGMKKAAAKDVDIMLAVELGPERPFGDSRLNCALVSRDAVLAEPQRRSKHEAADLLAGWLEQALKSG